MTLYHLLSGLEFLLGKCKKKIILSRCMIFYLSNQLEVCALIIFALLLWDERWRGWERWRVEGKRWLYINCGDCSVSDFQDRQTLRWAGIFFVFIWAQDLIGFHLQFGILILCECYGMSDDCLYENRWSTMATHPHQSTRSPGQWHQREEKTTTPHQKLLQVHWFREYTFGIYDNSDDR